MRKFLFLFAALLIAFSSNTVSFAQETGKKEDEKPKTTTTLDAWREALPQNELPAYQPPPAERSRNNGEIEESSEQVGNRVFALEQTLLESLKQRDSAALDQLLIDDFMLSGINLEGAQPDKSRYINWSLKNADLKSYTVEKTSIRAYPTIAIITVQYKNAAATADGNIIATDVWVKNGKQWQLLSRHLGQPFKL